MANKKSNNIEKTKYLYYLIIIALAAIVIANVIKLFS